MSAITPCLWFDTQGEDAARFYTSVFPNSRIVDVARFDAAARNADEHSGTIGQPGEPSRADWCHL